MMSSFLPVGSKASGAMPMPEVGRSLESPLRPCFAWAKATARPSQQGRYRRKWSRCAGVYGLSVVIVADRAVLDRREPLRVWNRCMVTSLNIVGAGRVGKTFARLWVEAGRVRIQQIMNRSLVSGAAAATFIGEGTPVSDWHELEPADLCMVATNDSALGACAASLAASGTLRPGSVVFHCSGAVGYQVLSAVERVGARSARLHALLSFASPEKAVQTFAGTHCGLEGDAEAVRVLEALVQACGGHGFRMPDAGAGAVYYHTGAVLVSNYLVALFEAGLACLAKAGFAPSEASAMLRGLAAGTLENVCEFGTSAALTGPIARGDTEVVRSQFEALLASEPALADVYRSLGTLAVELSRRQGSAPLANLAQIDALFQRVP